MGKQQVSMHLVARLECSRDLSKSHLIFEMMEPRVFLDLCSCRLALLYIGALLEICAGFSAVDELRFLLHHGGIR